MDLCMDRLFHLRELHLHDRPYRCHIPHIISCCEQSIIWYLGLALAGFQSSSHGLYLVRCAVVDRRYILSFGFHNQLCLHILGECVTLMIRSIWTSYAKLPNSIPASSGTNTRDFLSFFLFWFCSLPAIWFPVHQIRHLFTVKAYFVPVAGITFFIWAIVRAHGIGPIVHQGSTKSGGALGWAVVQGIMSSIANFATLIVRYAFLYLPSLLHFSNSRRPLLMLLLLPNF